jgi:4-amino-4-deoxy-L-arabinose transferase-like glycosyltransferase
VKLFPLPEKVGWRDHVIGALLASAYIAWLLATVRSLGFARDEGMYFRAASTYWRWFDVLFTHPSDAFKQPLIDSIWSDNHEHPPLVKDLFAFSWHFLHEKWHVFTDASTAYRFPGIVMTGATLWLTYLFGARAYSRQAGIVAALLFALMPRVFYNGHLACFDLPIVCMWTWSIYVYWRTQVEGGWLWAIGAGVVFGLTLATKHNAWILPGVFVPHALFVNYRTPLRGLLTGRLSVLFVMAVLGPSVCYAMWPWLWHDLWARLEWWVAYHNEHVYYNMEFFHVTYFSAPSPRLYMPVMILATVPTVTIALFVTGVVLRGKVHYERVVAWIRARARADATSLPEFPENGEPDLLFLLAFGAAISPWILFVKYPIFGGTKHWLPAYPFLCLFAGYGFDRVCIAMKRTLAEVARFRDDPRLLLGAQAALFVTVLAAPLAVTAHSHPFGLSSYVPLVGGTAGGADLGLNRQFWGFTTQSLEPYFEANAPRGATVYFHDTLWDSWARMIDEKRLRPDLRGVGSIAEAEFAMVQIERHMLEVEYNEWSVFGTDIPDYVLTHDGVPIIDVYRRRR